MPLEKFFQAVHALEVTELANEIMNTAASELGVHETPGEASTARILEYQEDYLPRRLLKDETPWCACFVGWVLDEAHAPPGTGKASARSYLNFGVAIPDAFAKYGDVVVFARPPKPWSGHVGFFHHRDSTHIYVLGGNQGNKVSIKAYPVKRLIGVRRPTWPARP